jgi:nitrite reductase/ring-hydroxylating ferredoxin subunit
MISNSFKTKLLTILFASILLSSCKKNKDGDTTIPYVPVNTIVQLNLPQFANLNSVGGTSIITGGYKGIVIYNKGTNEFVAYDLACPYDPTTDGTTLKVDTSGITTVDTHCGSKFNLYDGSITHGPATRPMKPYQCDFSTGNNTIYISN